MCKVMLVEIFWRMGVEKNKSPDTFHRGEVPTKTPYTHRPYLDLDFRKNVTWDREAPKNVT